MFAIAGLVMAGLIYLGYENLEQRYGVFRDVARNLTIAKTDCLNVQLVIDQNEATMRDTVVRDEMERVWQEGDCDNPDSVHWVYTVGNQDFLPPSEAHELNLKEELGVISP